MGHYTLYTIHYTQNMHVGIPSAHHSTDISNTIKANRLSIKRAVRAFLNRLRLRFRQLHDPTVTQVCQILKLQRGGNQSVRRGKDKRKPEICDLYLTFSLAAISTTLYLHVYKEYISKEEEDDDGDDDARKCNC